MDQRCFEGIATNMSTVENLIGPSPTVIKQGVWGTNELLGIISTLTLVGWVHLLLVSKWGKFNGSSWGEPMFYPCQGWNVAGCREQRVIFRSVERQAKCSEELGKCFYNGWEERRYWKTKSRFSKPNLWDAIIFLFFIFFILETSLVELCGATANSAFARRSQNTWQRNVFLL